MRTHAVVATLALAALSGVASADIYNLNSDFSELANPNGAWSFAAGSTLLTKHTPGNANAINAVVANGFWGVDAGTYVSSVMKTTGNGVDAAGYTNNDFLLGDIILHGTNPGSSNDLSIIWTAPSDGDLTVAGRTWYAHSVVNRVQDFSLSLNSSILDSGTLSLATNRPNAISFDGGGSLSVLAGDQIVFKVTPAAGQQFASIAGVDFTVDFTPVPAPAGLAALGMAGIVASRRRR